MYHGDTNFGRTAGGPYITTSYDYNAPLDGYSNLNQPKYRHLKELHAILHSMEKLLTHGDVSHQDMGNSILVAVYKTSDECGCFLSNTNTTVDAIINFQGALYDVPAWSVSILLDCKNEAYNTETWVMEKKENEAEHEPTDLKSSEVVFQVNSRATNGNSVPPGNGNVEEVEIDNQAMPMYVPVDSVTETEGERNGKEGELENRAIPMNVVVDSSTETEGNTKSTIMELGTDESKTLHKGKKRKGPKPIKEHKETVDFIQGSPSSTKNTKDDCFQVGSSSR
ncbi:hypothetical protein L6452_13621 [Arctium lappa]|uniref:Uncharacterized protein n=1 Tax=Arctium lappa TaxID=4217 RepID=A0ACB9CIT0_ARCLA|nr:hypothetical protein L6452_13621 [Arctium lappa]